MGEPKCVAVRYQKTCITQREGEFGLRTLRCKKIHGDATHDRRHIGRAGANQATRDVGKRCLSGDVNKDFSQLWKWIAEFVPLPDNLPVGQPLSHAPQSTANA